jgi:hypothetical protein
MIRIITIYEEEEKKTTNITTKMTTSMHKNTSRSRFLSTVSPTLP